MKYYAVIDTNVVVSAMLKSGSPPWEIIQEALNGKIIPLLNQDILDEYKEVLERAKFHFSSESVNRMINELPKRALFFEGVPSDEELPDPDDAIFYEVVMDARASTEAYLITGNLKHFPSKLFIVTPHEMLDIIKSNS